MIICGWMKNGIQLLEEKEIDEYFMKTRNYK